METSGSAGSGGEGGSVSSRFPAQRCRGTGSDAIKVDGLVQRPLLCCPSGKGSGRPVARPSEGGCVCAAAVGRQGTGANFTHLFWKVLTVIYALAAWL